MIVQHGQVAGGAVRARDRDVAAARVITADACYEHRDSGGGWITAALVGGWPAWPPCGCCTTHQPPEAGTHAAVAPAWLLGRRDPTQQALGASIRTRLEPGESRRGLPVGFADHGPWRAGTARPCPPATSCRGKWRRWGLYTRSLEKASLARPLSCLRPKSQTAEVGGRRPPQCASSCSNARMQHIAHV